MPNATQSLELTALAVGCLLLTMRRRDTARPPSALLTSWATTAMLMVVPAVVLSARTVSPFLYLHD